MPPSVASNRFYFEIASDARHIDRTEESGDCCRLVVILNYRCELLEHDPTPALVPAADGPDF
jgi:hypothetical protein